MAQNDDMRLLKEYALGDSQEAFATLVQRHINLVHSVAFRHVGDVQQAEDIAQAVFVLLAQKAARLGTRTVLVGWLYQAARLAASNFRRSELRRRRHEQEAFMESTIEKPQDPSWEKLAPLLDEAMGRLGEKERNAILLQFFEGQSVSEAAVALKLKEPALRKRVGRALEKLRKHFARRGMAVSVATIMALIGANSVQAAPVGCAAQVAMAAGAKGAAASLSSLALAKATLKPMAWMKAKTAIVVGVGVLLAAGTTTVTVKMISERQPESWQVGDEGLTWLRPPYRTEILPTANGGALFASGFDAEQALGRQASLVGILYTAYGSFTAYRTILNTKLPSGSFDYLSNLPHGARDALRQEIRRKFGIIARREMCETNVLLLAVKRPNAQGLKASADDSNRIGRSGDFTSNGFDLGQGRYSFHNVPLGYFAGYCEGEWRVPVIDQTGLTNKFDIDFTWRRKMGESEKDAFKQAMLDQLGLEFVPTNMPVEMLVVERVKN